MHQADGDKARIAGEKFALERANELKTNPEARRWEESRKKEAMDSKPEWKKQQLRKETDRDKRIINELRDGGHLMKGLQPAPGLLVVKTNETSDMTNGGIYLPDNVEYESNICTVLRASEYKMHQGVKEEAPCKEGDEILVRKGAGLNIKIKGEACLLIRFDEVFGVLE